MPRSTYYSGLLLPDAIERLAEHHYEANNRHISKDEYDLLQAAIAALRSAPRSPSQEEHRGEDRSSINSSVG